MKFTIQQFRERFPNDNACLEEVFRLRTKDVKECPKCKHTFNYKRVTTLSKRNKAQRKCYQCVSCGEQYYPLVGTIYEKSRTPLNFWFYAIYLMTVTRNGVAAKELERQLGITYKTGFRMAHRIRQLMKMQRDYYLDGVVQIDEAYIGGKLRFKSKKQRNRLHSDGAVHDNKIRVLGIVHNDETVTAQIIDKISSKEILPIIIANVDKGTIIVTDGESAYDDLEKLGYKHIVVRHDLNQYVNGEFTTNSIEGFWSQLKRTIKGTHIKVTKKYLQKYVDECTFRYAHRKQPTLMFDVLLKKLA